MMLVEQYLEVNLANWNSRVPHHAQSYGLHRFRADPAHLTGTVRFDLPRLGSIEALDIVHLQCHIGTDTLSLARLGAHTVTGLDFSSPALTVAAQLARDCGAAVDYRRTRVIRSRRSGRRVWRSSGIRRQAAPTERTPRGPRAPVT